jgi:uncharacterized protein YihD (DUF1040 family)
MKKAKSALQKKTNNIKKKSVSSPRAHPSAQNVVGRVKKLAQGLMKAMSAKPTKKPQVKAAPKSSVKLTVKSAVKPAAKLATHPAKAKAQVVATPAKAAAALAKKGVAQVAPAKTNLKTTPVVAGPAVKGKTPPPATNAKAAPVVAAVLTKGKGETKAKASRLTAAQLAEHLEKMCRETGCENQSTTKGYCRLDYIKNWKKIKRKEMILKEGKLNQYIEELVSKYPEKYIDVIRQDLNTEVNFNKVIHDLELDESIDDLDYDGDSIDALIGGIKKESEDFGDEDF